MATAVLCANLDPKCYRSSHEALALPRTQAYIFALNAVVVGPNDVPAEKGGAGANGYTYFVASFLGGPLSRLPAVKPAQIKAARQIKKFVTGKLDSQVITKI